MALVEESNRVPRRFTAGTSAKWRVVLLEVDPAANSLTWHFTREGCQPQSVQGVPDGDAFKGAFDPEKSRRFEPGVWKWQAAATETATGDKAIVYEGFVEVLPDPLARYEETHPEKMLAAVRAVQLKRQGKAYNAGDIAGTNFDYKTDEELRDAEQHFMSRVNHQKRVREARDRGGSPIAGRLHNRATA